MFKPFNIITFVLISLTLFLIYNVQSILFPFFMALVLAYLMDPWVEYGQKKLKMSRIFVTLLVISFFLGVLIAGLVFLIPVIVHQIANFVEDTPNIQNFVSNDIAASALHFLEKFDPDINQKIILAIEEFAQSSLHSLSSVLINVWQGGMAFLNILSLLFITPIIMFYILFDWQKIVRSFKELLPKKYKTNILQIIDDIDIMLAAYIRGQLNVCLVVGLFYSIGLVAIDLKYGLFIGLTTGLFSFMPFIGFGAGFVTGLIVSYIQYASIEHLILVGVVFGIGHIVEGYFLMPKFVGSKIGLHPAWTIFALLCGGSLFGIIGILLAIPIAAIVSILLKTYIKSYNLKS